MKKNKNRDDLWFPFQGQGDDYEEDYSDFLEQDAWEEYDEDYETYRELQASW
jgi:hypothetical protein